MWMLGLYFGSFVRAFGVNNRGVAAAPWFLFLENYTFVCSLSFFRTAKPPLSIFLSAVLGFEPKENLHMTSSLSAVDGQV